MISIDGKYFIKMDPYCYILCNNEPDKETGKKHTELSYHQTIQGVLKSYVRRSTRKTKPKSFKALMEELEKIDANIEKFVEDVSFRDIRDEYNKYRKEVEEETKKRLEARNKKKKK